MAEKALQVIEQASAPSVRRVNGGERRMRDLLIWLDDALPAAGIKGAPVYGGVAPVPGIDLRQADSLEEAHADYWTRLNDWLFGLRFSLGEALDGSVLVIDMPVRNAPTSAVFVPLAQAAHEDAAALDGALLSWLDSPTRPTRHKLAPGMSLPLGPLEDLGCSGVVVILDPASVLKASGGHSRLSVPTVADLLPTAVKPAEEKPPVLHCDIRGGHDRRMLDLTMHLDHGEMRGLVAKVRTREGTVARAFVSALDSHRHTITLHRPDGKRFGGGEHQLVVYNEDGELLYSEILRLRR